MKTTKKVRRFEIGGYGDTTEGMKEAYDASQSDEDLSRGGVEPAKSEAEPTKKQTFGQAFAEARDEALKGGPKTFTYNGKKYTTDVAGSKPKPSAPSSEISDKDMTRARGMQAGYEENLGRGARPAPAKAPATPRGVIKGTSAAEAMDMVRKASAARAAASPKVDPSQLTAQAAGRAAQDRGINAGAMENFKKMMGMKSGGKVSSASSRADGCAIRGKTRA
jgi:hypothetical protein